MWPRKNSIACTLTVTSGVLLYFFLFFYRISARDGRSVGWAKGGLKMDDTTDGEVQHTLGFTDFLLSVSSINKGTSN